MTDASSPGSGKLSSLGGGGGGVSSVAGTVVFAGPFDCAGAGVGVSFEEEEDEGGRRSASNLASGIPGPILKSSRIQRCLNVSRDRSYALGAFGRLCSHFHSGCSFHSWYALIFCL